jgi:hypothetical protein
MKDGLPPVMLGDWRRDLLSSKACNRNSLYAKGFELPNEQDAE